MRIPTLNSLTLSKHWFTPDRRTDFSVRFFDFGKSIGFTKETQKNYIAYLIDLYNIAEGITN
ncbi:hypothetical protein XBKB1_2380013 [Xenorhabdus bovienii str. kraussei Becker Underwood]|uniref:Uncharacterized protein n=1 Tax=Xenorhabdus bovienii str. kraussei Becker Underwood TaxID=1398204 RepID=A0A077PTY9_XENBV|nr:hypothetical protein XBKB1_2380013 [Xenorhabdus bovienii str. kraussei Becker Underwood]